MNEISERKKRKRERADDVFRLLKLFIWFYKDKKPDKKLPSIQTHHKHTTYIQLYNISSNDS